MTVSPISPMRINDVCFFSLFFFAIALPFSIAGATICLIVFLSVGAVKWARNPPGGLSGITPSEQSLLLYLGWVALGCFFRDSPLENLIDMRAHYMVLLLFIIPRVLTSVSQVQKVFIAFIVSSSLTALLGIFQFLSTDVLFLGRPAGTRSNPLTFAEGLLLVFSVLLPLLSRSISLGSLARWSAALTHLLGIISASCRGPWIAVVGVFAGLEWLKRRNLYVTLLVLVGISFFCFVHRSYLTNRFRSILSLKDNSNVERLHIWHLALRMSKEKPLVGFGSRSREIEKGYRTALGSKGIVEEKIYAEMHNMYFQVLVQSGFPGMLLFLLFFFQAGRACFSNLNDPIAQGTVLLLIGFLLSGLTESAFNDSEVKMTLFLLLGLSVAHKNAVFVKGSGAPS